jgi:hypothetical protein
MHPDIFHVTLTVSQHAALSSAGVRTGKQLFVYQQTCFFLSVHFVLGL